ncbi:FxsA family protein [Salinactinospora qingdaonensis]
MPLLIAMALLALPFLEIWLMIVIGQQIGAGVTIAALFAASLGGALVVRHAGTRAYRDAEEAIRTGTPPAGGVLDTLMLFVGGILLAIPGFVTAAVGLVLALPFTRPALRWLFSAWAKRRVERMRANADLVTLNGYPRTRPWPNAPSDGSQVVQGRVIHDDSTEK